MVTRATGLDQMVETEGWTPLPCSLRPHKIWAKISKGQHPFLSLLPQSSHPLARVNLYLTAEKTFGNLFGARRVVANPSIESSHGTGCIFCAKTSTGRLSSSHEELLAHKAILPVRHVRLEVRHKSLVGLCGRVPSKACLSRVRLMLHPYRGIAPLRMQILKMETKTAPTLNTAQATGVSVERVNPTSTSSPPTKCLTCDSPHLRPSLCFLRTSQTPYSVG